MFTTQQIIEALKANRGLVYLASESLGCDPSTIFRRAKKIKKIRSVMNFFRRRRVDRAELALDDRIASGESWAIQFTLKTLGKKRGYTEKQEIEHSGSIATPTTFADWVKMEELKKKKKQEND